MTLDIRESAEKLWFELIDCMNVNSEHAYKNNFKCDVVSHIESLCRKVREKGKTEGWEQGLDEAAKEFEKFDQGDKIENRHVAVVLRSFLKSRNERSEKA